MNRPPSRSLGARQSGRQRGLQTVAVRLRHELQRNMDWSAAWWTGRERWWADQEAAGLREPIYQLYAVPLRRPANPNPRQRGPVPPGFPDTMPPPPPVAAAQRRMQRYELFGMGLRMEQDGLVQLQADVEAGRGDIGYLMDPVRPTGLRLRKILGKGGQGVVALFELRDRNRTGPRGSRRTRKVVVKGPLWDDESFRRFMAKEKVNVLKMTGAKHIVQRQPIQNLVNIPQQPLPQASLPFLPEDRAAVPLALIPGGTQQLQREAAARVFDELPDMYAMEFMKFGDAHSLLVKRTTQGARWRSEELWMVFECLLKGVTAMTFPGTWAPPGSSQPGRNIPLQDEVAPANISIDLEKALVHFDLDPYNVMIGDFDPVAREHSHNKVPVFKIGDLGVATDIPAQMKSSVRDMNLYRTRGKPTYLTPEQTTKEWNFVGPNTDMTQESTAGQYGWESNIFQIGGVMACFITGEASQYPPEARQFQLCGANGYTEMAWTYGGRCLDDEFAHIDAELRLLVAWCMVHRPSQRPHLCSLEDEIRRNIVKDWATLEVDWDSTATFASILSPPLPLNPTSNNRPLPNVPASTSNRAVPANWRPLPQLPGNNGQQSPPGRPGAPQNAIRQPPRPRRRSRPLPPLPPGAGRGAAAVGNEGGGGAGPDSANMPFRPFSWQRSPGATVLGGRIAKRPSSGSSGGRPAGRRLPDAFKRALRGYDAQEAGGGGGDGNARTVIDVINPRANPASASSGDGGDAAEPRNRLQRMLARFRRIRLR